MSNVDLSVSIGSLTLANPFIAASGCFGYGVEYAEVVDLATLGAVAVKGLFLDEREGHPPERIVETPSGMLNAIGLQGIGVRRFVAEKLPPLRERGAVVIVNICGSTIREYAEVARILDDAAGVAAIELNISCPNIKKGGMLFGSSLRGTHDVVAAVRKVTRRPLIPKLTPNVADVASFATAARDAGADAVSLVNTFLAMAIDVETRRPRLSNVVGGVERPRHPPHRGPHGARVPPGGVPPPDRHGRHHDRRGRARVPDRRRHRGPGGHRQLRRPVHLGEADGGTDRLPAASRPGRRERDRRLAGSVAPPRRAAPAPDAMRLTLYTRPGCHLCEEMKAVVRRVQGQVACELAEVDISLDEALLRRYRHHIPVLLADGVEVARTRIGVAELLATLESGPDRGPAPNPPGPKEG